jgi:pyruvate dehydrogenase E1 component
MRVARSKRLGNSGETSWVEQCLDATEGPVIAVSDYVSAVPDLIRAWVPRRYAVLGTDGYGRSDTRAALRSYFEVDRHSIAVTALVELADEGAIDRAIAAKARERYAIDPASDCPWAR